VELHNSSSVIGCFI